MVRPYSGTHRKISDSLHLSVARIGRVQADVLMSGYFWAVIGSAGSFLDAKHVISLGLAASSFLHCTYQLV